MIPDWLRRTQEYPARSDRDAFIEMSIRSVLGLLSRFRRPRAGAGKGGRVNARVGLASAVLLILLLSLSRDVLFVAYAGALLLAILSFQRGQVILRILKTGVPIAMFTALLMLPSALWGNPASLTVIPLKVFFSVITLRLLVENEPWESILGALFFLPRLFILVLDITTRYLVLLGEHSLALLWALKLRSVGRNSRKAASLAGIVGALFLTSRAMAEETYAAMECRCFTGRYPRRRAPGTSVADLAAFGLDALSIFLFFAVRPV